MRNKIGYIMNDLMWLRAVIEKESTFKDLLLNIKRLLKENIEKEKI